MLLRDGVTQTADPRLDWIPFKKPENRGYQARMALDGEVELPISLTGRQNGLSYWLPNIGQNQGREGACVAFAKGHRINGSPVRRGKRDLIVAAEMFGDYHAIQHRDPWAGCALGPNCTIDPQPQTYSGTSVHSGADYARAMGQIDSYWWIGAGSGDVGADLLDVLERWGSIVLGIGWTNSMYYPDGGGLLEVFGDFIGGHSLLAFEHAPRARLKGYSKPQDVVWLQQSWGHDHGVKRRGVAGCVAVRTEDLVNKLLLAAGHWAGEGCVYVEAA